jgi:hypothetical protein
MVANRRSLATRIAVTRGTASLISAGSGPRCGADATRVAGTAVATVRTLAGAGAARGAESERTTRPASGLSAGGGGGFRAAGDFGVDSGFFAGSLTASGFDSDGFAGTLSAGADLLRGVGLGAGGRAVTPGAGTLASVGGGTGALGVDVFGRGSVTSGCMRVLGTVLPAVADAGFVGLAAGLFAATLPGGGFRAAGTFTAATARLDVGGFAAVFDGGAFGGFTVAGLSTVALAEVGGVDFAIVAGALTAGLTTVA